MFVGVIGLIISASLLVGCQDHYDCPTAGVTEQEIEDLLGVDIVNKERFHWEDVTVNGDTLVVKFHEDGLRANGKLEFMDPIGEIQQLLEQYDTVPFNKVSVWTVCDAADGNGTVKVSSFDIPKAGIDVLKNYAVNIYEIDEIGPYLEDLWITPQITSWE